MKNLWVLAILLSGSGLHGWSMTFLNRTPFQIQVVVAFEARQFSCGGVGSVNTVPSQQVRGNTREILPGQTSVITSMDCCFQKVFITTLNVPAGSTPPADLDFKPDATRCADSVWMVVVDKGALNLVKQY